MRSFFIAEFTVLACAIAACNHKDPPSDLRVELPSLIDSRDPVTVRVTASNSAGAMAAVTDGLEFSVEPSGLASVGPAGLLTCDSSGDGKLTASIAGVSRSVPVRCRIVDRIEAQDVGRVELTAGPFKPKARALDKTGAELGDVEISYVSKNSGVVFPKDGQLVPKLVGSATLTARAGQASADFKVDVVRKVVVEALPIDNNRRIYFSLDAGKYELTVKLPSAKHMTVEWRGAPYCNAASEGLVHVSTCALREQGGGGVVFDNPAYLSDPKAKKLSLDGVELFEVP